MWFVCIFLVGGFALISSHPTCGAIMRISYRRLKSKLTLKNAIHDSKKLDTVLEDDASGESGDEEGLPP